MNKIMKLAQKWQWMQSSDVRVIARYVTSGMTWKMVSGIQAPAVPTLASFHLIMIFTVKY